MPYMAFGSGTKLRLLSNFADAPFELTWREDAPRDLIPAHMAGHTGVYPTSEHAYQALRSLNLATARAFEVGGRLASWDVYRAWPASRTTTSKTADMRDRKVAHWGRLGCSGIIPKMAVNLSPRTAKALLGLDLVEPNGRHHTLEQDFAIWLPILMAKYRANPPHRRMLLDGTGGDDTILYEHGRFSAPDQHWTAHLDKPTNRLIGHNRMGNLMRVARALLAHEARHAESPTSRA
jgi:hypothetical protein